MEKDDNIHTTIEDVEAGKANSRDDERDELEERPLITSPLSITSSNDSFGEHKKEGGPNATASSKEIHNSNEATIPTLPVSTKNEWSIGSADTAEEEDNIINSGLNTVAAASSSSEEIPREAVPQQQSLSSSEELLQNNKDPNAPKDDHPAGPQETLSSDEVPDTKDSNDDDPYDQLSDGPNDIIIKEESSDEAALLPNNSEDSAIYATRCEEEDALDVANEKDESAIMIQKSGEMSESDDGPTATYTCQESEMKAEITTSSSDTIPNGDGIAVGVLEGASDGALSDGMGVDIPLGNEEDIPTVIINESDNNGDFAATLSAESGENSNVPPNDESIPPMLESYESCIPPDERFVATESNTASSSTPLQQQTANNDALWMEQQQQQHHQLSPSEARPGAFPSSGGTVGGSLLSNTNLSQTELDILSKQRDIELSTLEETRPGAYHASGADLMSQSKRDLLAKSESRNGSFRVSSSSTTTGDNSGEVSNGNLSQTELDILSKQRGQTILSDARPGAYHARGEGVHRPHNNNNTSLSQTEVDILAKQRGLKTTSNTRPGAFHAMGDVSRIPSNKSLSQTESDLLAKQGGIRSSDESRLGAFRETRGTGASGMTNRNLRQTEIDLLAKQSLMTSSSESQPGAHHETGNNSLHRMTNESLSQTESDLLAKQWFVTSSESQPGAHHETGNSSLHHMTNQNLSQIESDVLAKQRGFPLSKSRPGAHHEMRGDNLDHLNSSSSHSDGKSSVSDRKLTSLEQDLLLKQQLGSSFGSYPAPGAVPISGEDQLRRAEHHISEKSQQFTTPLQYRESRPGAEPVSGDGRLTATEQRILEKTQQLGTPMQPNDERRPGAMPISGEASLRHAEHELLEKTQQLPSEVEQRESRPGAVPMSAGEHLRQFESSMLVKSGNTTAVGEAVSAQNPERSSDIRGDGVNRMSQFESDLLAKQNAIPVRSTTLVQFERTLLQKQGIIDEAASGASGTANGRLEQMERDILRKEEERTAAVSGPGAISSNAGRIEDFERRLLAKGFVADNNQENEREDGTIPSPIEQFEASLISKNEAQSSLRASSGGVRAANARLDDFENSILAKAEADFDHGGPQQLSSSARMPSGSPAGTLLNFEAELRSMNPPQPSRPLHPSHSFRMHPRSPMAGLLDEGEPDTGEDIASVPAPMSMPGYDFEHAEQAYIAHSAARSEHTNSNSLDGIEAYVPPTVVDAAGVAVVDPEEEQRKEKLRRRVYFFICAAILLAIAVVVIVPSVLTSMDDEGFEPLGPTAFPSVAPSLSPSAAPTSSLFAEFLDEVLLPLGRTDEEALNNPRSPQYRAALWLIMEDSEQFWPDAELSVRNARVVQRYALGVFHYAVDGNYWRRCGKEANECGNGRWLAATDECTWYGVICNSETGVVETILFPENGNQLLGRLPPELSLLSDLKRFVAPDDEIGGDLTVAFQGLTLLDTLILRNNELVGPLPAELIANNPNLGVLDLAENQLTGTLPASLESAEKLSQLQLFGNAFTGTILAGIGNATRLQLLDLSLNQLEGSIPESIYNLPNLATLYLGSNANVAGTIDDRIGQLTSLVRLDVGGTQLQGSIPDILYTFTSLQRLVLKNANFSGPLKEELRWLNSTLVHLELNNNRFSGSLPSALDEMTLLETLLLQNNGFTGTISQAVCSERRVGSHLEVDCNIECNCNDNPDCR